jgi:type I restriction enzyme S subunit
MNEEQELPQGWVWASFNQVGKWTGGGTPSKAMPDFWAEPSVLWVSPKDMKSAVIIDSEDKINVMALDASAVKLIEASALLFVVRSGILRRTLPTAVLGKQATVNQDIRALTPLIPDLTSYLYYISQGFNDHIRTSCMKSGTTVESIEVPLLQQYSFPLPPLPEQRRIVAKLEELFSKLDAGVAAVRRTQALLKRYRQSVLHAAVTGELTRTWREAHPPAPAETGAALLQRIRAERRAQWEAAQVAKRGGQLPLGEGWKAKYTEPKVVDTAELPELPEGWVWGRLSQVSEAVGGFAFSSQAFSNAGEYQVIKMANVKPGKLMLDNRPAFISTSDVKEDVLTKYILKKDDCVITLTGTREKRDYGFIARVKDETNLLINQRLAYMRFYSPLFAPFFEYALMSKHFLDNFFKYETGNVGQGNVGMKAITDETIMLPPLSEQTEIVAEVERRLTVLDALGQTLTDELRRAERLRQSILHRAFTGRLVPQDAADEPAAALLARLRATPAAPAKAKAGRGRKAPAQQATLGL